MIYHEMQDLHYLPRIVVNFDDVENQVSNIYLRRQF